MAMRMILRLLGVFLLGILVKGDDSSDNIKLVGTFKLQDQTSSYYLKNLPGSGLDILTAVGPNDSKVTYVMEVYGTAAPYISLKSCRTPPNNQYVTRAGKGPGQQAKTTTDMAEEEISGCKDDRLFLYDTTSNDLISLFSEAAVGRDAVYLVPDSTLPKLHDEEIFWSLYNYLAEFDVISGQMTVDLTWCVKRKRRSTKKSDDNNCPSIRYIGHNSANQLQISSQASNDLSIKQFEHYLGCNAQGVYETGEAIIIGVQNSKNYLQIDYDMVNARIQRVETRSRNNLEPIRYQSVSIRYSPDTRSKIPLPQRCTNSQTVTPSGCNTKYAEDERVFVVERISGNKTRLRHSMDPDAYLAALKLTNGDYKLVVTSLTDYSSSNLVEFQFNIPVNGIPNSAFHGPDVPCPVNTGLAGTGLAAASYVPQRRRHQARTARRRH